MEPRQGSSRGRRRALTEVVRGTADGWPAREGRRPGGVRPGRRPPPGAERGAGLHRGRAGTGERPGRRVHGPATGARRTTGPGVARGLPPGAAPATATTHRAAGQGSGPRATSDAPRAGPGGSRRGASDRRRWGTEAHGRAGVVGPSPRGPDTRERRERTTPDHGRPVDGARAAAARPDEPEACMAHVRVCGGAGWVTTGSTRQLTASSVRYASASGCS